MNINIKVSKKVFNDVYLPYLENQDRYLVFYGGGSSGKSYFIAQRFIYKLIHPVRCNLLVVRQTGDTNRRSTFPLLKQVISHWNLSQHFKINESDMRIKCLLTGNEVAFAGLDDVEKIKSITFENGELTDIWVEEATETQEADINQLKVRLRGGKSKKQIVLSFNPINIQHWIKKHFIDSKLATVCFSTYKDNKFLTDDDRKALEDLKYIDEYTYEVYCLGKWGILGKTVFDARAIQKRLDEIPKPIKTGYFKYDYDGLRISNIRWVNDKENGYIRLYKLPNVPQYTEYCIGGDTAGEGSDFFIGQVLDAKTGEQVAVLKHQFDSDQYTKQMYCLGKYYKDALIGIEANFDSFPIMELKRLGYTKQYVREAQDTYTGKTEKRYGFKTTSLTRPTAISRLIEIVREHCDTINDKDTLEELLTIIRNEKGRIEAPEGGHDDQMMGLAIAHQIREQVVFPNDVIYVKPQHHFDVEKMFEVAYDYGEEMTIV
ncbi:MAG: PBSX family phage terminase large subunit [Acutalibacteraceae bacterium]|nr:PBSX family phage terminase large subunit [Acutalibacteraceae bacterium]